MEQIEVALGEESESLEVNLQEQALTLTAEVIEVQVGPKSTSAVDTVTTLDPGQPVSVQDVGTPGAAVFNFGIPRGEKGNPGANGAGFDYTQASASDTWVIAHNLGFRPSVTTYTVGGVEMVGSVAHLSTDVVQINFNTPVAGFARLN